MLQRHRAAVVIQRQIKGRVATKKFKNVKDSSIVIQSGNFPVTSYKVRIF